MFALRRTAKVVRFRALAIVSTLFVLGRAVGALCPAPGSKALVAFRSFPLRLHFDLAATTIFNRAARLRTAAVLRFICVAIAATLIPESASVGRRLSSSDVQGMLPKRRADFFALTESEAPSFRSLSNLVLQMVVHDRGGVG